MVFLRKNFQFFRHLAVSWAHVTSYDQCNVMNLFQDKLVKDPPTAVMFQMIKIQGTGVIFSKVPKGLRM